jgi:polar amino acid transport system substrate-binding protein
MPVLTLTPGTLIVQSAYPDPPFDIMENGTATGFDIELMRAVCKELHLAMRPVAYSGDDFNGIFDAVMKRECDAVISGTTITPERAAVVLFSQPYLEFNQGIAVNAARTPRLTSTADLRGLTAGIQSGNTSDRVARTCWCRATSRESATIRITGLHQRSTTSRSDASGSLSSCSR